MRRTGAAHHSGKHFLAEQVEADAVHGQVVRREGVGGLLEEEPHLDPEAAFGADATVHLETRSAAHVLTSSRPLTSWRTGNSVLLQ
jgi:hypothetical protein